MSRLIALAAAALLFAACYGTEGTDCFDNNSCNDGLACVTWWYKTSDSTSKHSVCARPENVTIYQPLREAKRESSCDAGIARVWR